MKKKIHEKQEAVRLREEGCSLNAISSQLGVSKGSVSAWVKKVPVASKKKAELRSNPHSHRAIEKRKTSRLKNEKAKRSAAIKRSAEDIQNITHGELWLIGVSLYWAEGGKTQRLVRFSNGDPEMIKVMMRFFTEVCNVPKKKIKGYIHIHEHLDVKCSEKYWQEASGLPADQFYRTYKKPKTLSKRRTLPYGVMELYIMDVSLFLKIQGWTKGISDVINLPNK